MASIHAVIVPSKTVKGGKNKVRIAIAHNGDTRYIVTDIIIDSNKEFKNGMVVKRPDAAMLNTKIRNLLQRYQSALDELDYIDGLTCPELVFQLRNSGKYKHRTLKSIYEEYIASANITDSSALNYRSIWHNISGYIGDKTLAENINHGTVLGLHKYLFSQKKRPTTVRYNMVFLLVLLNYAQRCGYVQFRVHPFFGYTLPEMEVRQSWLTVEQIKAIRDCPIAHRPTSKCRDLFMLSYYLGGINMVDLLKINFDETPGRVRYVRQKTKNRPKLNKYVEFAIPEEAQAIIDKYKGDDGYLKATQHQRETGHHCFLCTYIKRIAKLTGIKNLVYYSARKSFSQHAFDLGISTSIIDFILGHRVDKGGTSLYAYISVTPQMATEAVRKVLDNLK